MSGLHSDQAEKERRDLFHQAVKRIGKTCEAGGVESALVKGQGVPSDHLNEVWVACQQDLASMDQYRVALSAWETDNYKKINELKEQGDGEKTLQQASLFNSEAKGMAS